MAGAHVGDLLAVGPRSAVSGPFGEIGHGFALGAIGKGIFTYCGAPLGQDKQGMRMVVSERLTWGS